MPQELSRLSLGHRSQVPPFESKFSEGKLAFSLPSENVQSNPFASVLGLLRHTLGRNWFGFAVDVFCSSDGDHGTWTVMSKPANVASSRSQSTQATIVTVNTGINYPLLHFTPFLSILLALCFLVCVSSYAVRSQVLQQLSLKRKWNSQVRLCDFFFVTICWEVLILISKFVKILDLHSLGSVELKL